MVFTKMEDSGDKPQDLWEISIANLKAIYNDYKCFALPVIFFTYLQDSKNLSEGKLYWMLNFELVIHQEMRFFFTVFIIEW